jgi:hypothetical protein
MIGAKVTCEPQGEKSNPKRAYACARVGRQHGLTANSKSNTRVDQRSSNCFGRQGLPQGPHASCVL